MMLESADPEHFVPHVDLTKPDPAAAPSRLTFQAGALPFGAKIELQAVAAHDR